jgi:processive 1,2-diacylglycerol beta-glucosyltransferase
MGKKLLIMSASVGGGHNSASQALVDAAAQIRPDAEVEWVDTLDVCGKLMKKLYRQSYVESVNRTPSLWGAFYKGFDKSSVGGKTAQLMDLLDGINAKRIADFVNQKDPDHVLCTHLIASNSLLSHRGRKYTNKPISVIVTDYHVHFFWMHKGVDTYFVASDECAYVINKHARLRPKRLIVSGIPIKPVFSKRHNCKVLRKKFRLREGVPSVLVMCGGFGFGDVDATIKAVLGVERKLDVILITGNNKKLYNKLTKIKAGKDKRLKVLGFVNNMHEYMTACDFAISKSGGLTTSEALACGLPLIVFPVLPGQEEHNADYLVQIGAGIKPKHAGSLQYRVKWLVDNPGEIRRMKKAAKAAAHPKAAFDVIKALL